MKLSLLFDPLLIVEKLGWRAARLRRLRRLLGTPAASLTDGHIASQSLLDIVAAGSKPRVLYDVGAHTGTWTQLAKSIFPNAQIEAFEPLTEHVSEFLINTSGLTGVRLHNIGVGASNYEADIRITNRSDSSSLLPLTSAAESTYSLKHVVNKQVPIRSLDSMIEAGQADPPDLIKLDVQGFEVEVLKGAQKTLETCTWVISEVSFEEYYVGQPLFHDVAQVMSEFGYRVYALSHATPLGVRLTQADVLFAKVSNLRSGPFNP
jgi:FkbM family methyltransferase